MDHEAYALVTKPLQVRFEDRRTTARRQVHLDVEHKGAQHSLLLTGGGYRWTFLKGGASPRENRPIMAHRGSCGNSFGGVTLL